MSTKLVTIVTTSKRWEITAAQADAASQLATKLSRPSKLSVRPPYFVLGIYTSK